MAVESALPVGGGVSRPSLVERLAALDRHQEQVQQDGIPALQRLMAVARRPTGQGDRIARFLLGLYNGKRFPFDLTELRGLDFELFEDCLRVLRKDYQPVQEVHRYFPDGSALFEALAERLQ